MKYLQLITKQLFQNYPLNSGICRNAASRIAARFATTSSAQDRADMEELFLDQRVRYLLKRLTGYDPFKVFETQSISNLKAPKYRFLTDEQLAMEKKIADQKAEKILQMPPVKYAKKFEPKLLEKDDALKGFLDPSVKLIFMDATPGFSDHERLMVVREPDGTLREATRDERHRTIQIFYPVEERHIDYPFMFQEPHINDVLDRNGYKSLLDNACLHFEPDDERYIEICHKVYKHIEANNMFDCLKYTRHYGGMAYHYVFNGSSDSLLKHLLTSQKYDDAFSLLRLFYIVNPRDSVPSSLIEDQDAPKEGHFREDSLDPVPIDNVIQLLEIYINNDSKTDKKSHLQMVLQKLKEDQMEKKAKAQN